MLSRPLAGRVYVTVALMAAIAACSRTRERTPSGAWLEAHWTGSDTGRISTSATAEWCDSLRVLEIRALQGDSGLALAVYPRAGLTAGRYPVGPPERVDSNPPGAAVALRWFAETAIKGLRSVRGEVRLDRSSSGVVSGDFEADLAAVNASDRLHVRGSFRGLEVRPAARGCAREPDSSSVDRDSSVDTGVD